jgi:hypothetical protein
MIVMEISMNDRKKEEGVRKLARSGGVRTFMCGVWAVTNGEARLPQWRMHEFPSSAQLSDVITVLTHTRQTFIQVFRKTRPSIQKHLKTIHEC